MPNYNQITIVGHIGKVTTDQQYKSFSLAYSKKYKDKYGEEKKETTWFKCTAFGDNQGLVISKYLTQGMAVMVVGELRATAYTDNSGIAKPNLDIAISRLVMLGDAKNKTDNASVSVGLDANNNTFDDEIPF